MREGTNDEDRFSLIGNSAFFVNNKKNRMQEVEHEKLITRLGFSEYLNSLTQSSQGGLDGPRQNRSG